MILNIIKYLIIDFISRHNYKIQVLDAKDHMTYKIKNTNSTALIRCWISSFQLRCMQYPGYAIGAGDAINLYAGI